MDQKKFVAIRMIVVNPDNDPSGFEAWMTGTFLNAMGGLFKPGGGLYQTGKCPALDQVSGLERIIFLQGNKDPNAVQSENRPDRDQSTPAGANADYAWITCWTNFDANKRAWSCSDRPIEWYNDVPLGSTPDDRGLWNQFLDRCYPRKRSWWTTPSGFTPNLVPWVLAADRPPHGSPYDYYGAPGQQFEDPPPLGHFISHIGRGAGCLVEGFELIYCKSDWPDWPV